MSIKAPWTPDQVEALNAFQHSQKVHPFTCGNDRGDAAHRAYAEAHGEDMGQLVAHEDGWHCPVCDYRQDWAHEFMFQPIPMDAMDWVGFDHQAISLVRDHQGMKATDLAAELVRWWVGRVDTSRLELLTAEKLVRRLTFLVENHALIEVEYILPNMNYRAKSFYLPAETEVQILKGQPNRKGEWYE
jgi:hypothetical protein